MGWSFREACLVPVVDAAAFFGALVKYLMGLSLLFIRPGLVINAASYYVELFPEHNEGDD